jgi:hypothetical protein
MCHNTATLTAGLDLSTYAGVMNGSKDGSILVPGDSANSLLIKIQSATHFRNVTPDELALIKQWINAGALER